MLYPLSYEGGVCAVTCANRAQRGQFVACQATSETFQLLEGSRR